MRGGRWATRQEHMPSCPPTGLSTSPQVKPYFNYATKLVLIQHFYFTFVMFHVKRCAFLAFPQQIIKSCDVIAPTFSTVPLRDPSTTSSEPSPPSSSLLHYLNGSVHESGVSHETPTPTRQPVGERQYTSTAISYTSTIRSCFHVKPLSHCAPTKLTFHAETSHPALRRPQQPHHVSRETWRN